MKLLNLITEDFTREILQDDVNKVFNEISKILGKKWSWPYDKKGSAYNFKDGTRTLSVQFQNLGKDNTISFNINPVKNQVRIHAVSYNDDIFDKIFTYKFKSDKQDLTNVVKKFKPILLKLSSQIEQRIDKKIKSMSSYYKGRKDSNRAFIKH